MRPASLLLLLFAAVAFAQTTDRGFVNQRLLRPNFFQQKAVLNVTPSRGAVVVAPPSQRGCARIPLIERLPTPKVDQQMILPHAGSSVDPKMVIEPPPACPDR
jgi:hypothetical protein